jgi:DNA-binding response OmpR family regulator
VRFGDIVVDTTSRTVSRSGELIDLTPKEFDLLAFLCRNARKVYSRGDLLTEVWDSSSEWQDPATVTVHVRRLRQKIEADPTEPAHLVTVYGIGYRFEP